MILKRIFARTAPPIRRQIGPLGRKPDLICIGAQKAATTWVFRVLAARPDTWTPPIKEVHFFNHLHVAAHPWTEWLVRQYLSAAEASYLRDTPLPDPDYLEWLKGLKTPPILDEAWYQRLFAPAPPDRLALEATPEYSVVPPEGVDHIAAFLPETRFIYMIRDPVSRALSHLRMNLSRQETLPETEDDWDAVAADPALWERGDYASYVPRWKGKFGPDRLLFLPYGDVAARPAATLRAIERFAGLVPHTPHNLKKRINKTRPIPVPDRIKARIAEQFAPQRDFVLREFGRDFASRT